MKLIWCAYLISSYAFNFKRNMLQSRKLFQLSSTSNQGSIQVFSRPGCKFCRIAKSKLNELGIQYDEIDISSIDTKNLDDITKQRYDFTLTTTVPQIFIADQWIGGCDNLLKEVESRQLFQRLDYSGIKYGVNNIDNTVATTTITTTTTTTEDQTPVKYRVLGNSLNEYIDFQATLEIDAFTLSQQLQRIILQLSDKFITSDGKKVDYKQMNQSIEFQNYCELSNYLRYYDINTLASTLKDEKIRFSFLVNIYNAMIIHATCIYGPPEDSPAGRTIFFSGSQGGKYNIGGYLFSPDDIEHGLLRANTAHPSKQALGEIHYFNTMDIRTCLAMSTLDYRVHFILNCGASSCPPIAILDSTNVDMALTKASELYLGEEVKYDSDTRKLYLPKLLLWYGNDFGTSISTRLRNIISLLPISLKTSIIQKWLQIGYDVNNSTIDDVTKLPFEIMYNNYDWTPNSA